MVNGEKPVKQFRIGSIKASVWANEVRDSVFYNTTFENNYRTEDGEWRQSKGYSLVELGVLAQLASMAAHWIAEQ